MKPSIPVKIERDAARALQDILAEVPFVDRVDVTLPKQSDAGFDFVADMIIGDERRTLVCEVKSSGQPRFARMALLQLRDYLSRSDDMAIPVFIAPYLSPEVQALCREQDASYLDFEGNVRLVFDRVFIERRSAGKPTAERREIRSIFKPKSAQVLRAMLADPQRSWKVADLAHSTGTSLGHVSNVRAALLAREWAQRSPDGIFIAKPDAVLDAWREAYVSPTGERLRFYTTLHGKGFGEAVKKLANDTSGDGTVVLASFTAAQWLAPYGRTGTQYFYADEIGLDRLKVALALQTAEKGDNVAITVTNDSAIFKEAIEPAPGAVCTSLIQTYLDLYAAGERGREAAEHLRREKLKWLV